MVTDALQNIYRSLFEDPTTERIYTFQQLAADSFTPEGKAAFIAYLIVLNDGVDPELTDDQILAFGYLMKADQNCNTAKPWPSSELEIW